MNERIKELIEQCIDQRWTVTGPMFDREKFAELIVRECAGIAAHHVMNISTYADAEFVAEQLKEHFGVE